MIFSKIKMLKEVVYDLRDKGELDEIKLGKLKNKVFLFGKIITLIILLVFGYYCVFIRGLDKSANLVFMFNLLLVLLIVIPAGFVIITRVVNKILLYTIGEKTFAETVYAGMREGTYFIKYYVFNYIYEDIYGKQNSGSYTVFNEPDYIEKKESFKIEILYLKNNLETSMVFDKNLNEKYNLRKN